MHLIHKISDNLSTSSMVCSDEVSVVQSELRTRLCGTCTNNLMGLDKERKQLFELLHRTTVYGESNSILIIGPRGSGKTSLLRSVLGELKEDKKTSENLLEVHLSGLLQTDDRLVLNDITRQLHLENSTEDKVFGSFAENLQFLLDTLKSGDKQSKSILFILEEFDMFTQHRNQTMLYNLFDVAQSAQAPICVIGLTVRLDVLELLEKRVKSRFSHRFLHLLPTYDFTDYLATCKTVLTLPESSSHSQYTKEWNHRVQVLLDEAGVLDVLRQQFSLTKSIRVLHQLLMLPVCGIHTNHPYITSADMLKSYRILHKDAKAAMLQGVSVLELTLVLAMNHLTQTYDSAPFNFEMVYHVYQKFAQRSSSQLFEKPVVMKAFEHLCSLELVRPAEGSNSRVQREYRLMNLMADEVQIHDALHRYPGCPSELKQWTSFSLT